MSGFFSKLFGGGKRTEQSPIQADGAPAFVEEMMAALLERAGLDLDMAISVKEGPEEEIAVELSGPDEDLLFEKDGALLDSFQLFVKRALQHRMADCRANVVFDCDGFREEANRELVDLAERLKERALEQGRAVYLRALPPKDRKVVHQYLASDDRVKSRSVGEGLYKKIKIYPTREDEDSSEDDDSRGGDGRSGPKRSGGGRSARGPSAGDRSPEEAPPSAT